MRATGQTFRKVLEAVIKASEGYRVHYVCNDVNQAERAFRFTMQMIEHHTYKMVGPRTCEFHSGGRLAFISKTREKHLLREMTETKAPLFIHDHYQGER